MPQAETKGKDGALDKTRFSRICGMLGSAHDGERSAAALLATRMLADAGLTWADIFAEAERQQAEPTEKTDRQGALTAFDLILRCDDAFNRHAEKLGPWDVSFMEGMFDLADRFGLQVRLSPKQWAHLVRIAGRMGVAV